MLPLAKGASLLQLSHPGPGNRPHGLIRTMAQGLGKQTLTLVTGLSLQVVDRVLPPDEVAAVVDAGLRPAQGEAPEAALQNAGPAQTWTLLAVLASWASDATGMMAMTTMRRNAVRTFIALAEVRGRCSLCRH